MIITRKKNSKILYTVSIVAKDLYLLKSNFEVIPGAKRVTFAYILKYFNIDPASIVKGCYEYNHYTRRYVYYKQPTINCRPVNSLVIPSAKKLKEIYITHNSFIDTLDTPLNMKDVTFPARIPYNSVTFKTSKVTAYMAGDVVKTIPYGRLFDAHIRISTNNSITLDDAVFNEKHFCKKLLSNIDYPFSGKEMFCKKGDQDHKTRDSCMDMVKQVVRDIHFFISDYKLKQLGVSKKEFVSYIAYINSMNLTPLVIGKRGFEMSFNCYKGPGVWVTLGCTGNPPYVNYFTVILFRYMLSYDYRNTYDYIKQRMINCADPFNLLLEAHNQAPNASTWDITDGFEKPGVITLAEYVRRLTNHKRRRKPFTKLIQ